MIMMKRRTIRTAKKNKKSRRKKKISYKKTCAPVNPLYDRFISVKYPSASNLSPSHALGSPVKQVTHVDDKPRRAPNETAKVRT
jgi:hypothetical protein